MMSKTKKGRKEGDERTEGKEGTEREENGWSQAGACCVTTATVAAAQSTPIG